MKTARDIAESLPPQEAVEYLLGVVEMQDAASQSDHHPVDTWGHMRRLVRRLAIRLYDAPGLVTHDALFWSMYFDRRDGDDLPGSNLVAIHISMLRKSLPAGYHVRPVWGLGYVMDKP